MESRTRRSGSRNSGWPGLLSWPMKSSPLKCTPSLDGSLPSLRRDWDKDQWR